MAAAHMGDTPQLQATAPATLQDLCGAAACARAKLCHLTSIACGKMPGNV